MWRASASGFRSKILLSSHGARANPCHPAISSPSSILRPPLSPRDGVVSVHLHSSSAVDSWKLREEAAIGFAAAAASPVARAAVLGPSTAASLVSRKFRDVAEAAHHYGRCYWELSKARLSMLVVATSGAGFVLGSGGVIDFAGLCWTCAGTSMVAASANSLNQVFEVQNDAKMKRTRQRPLPSGRVTVPHAAVWALGVGITGTSLLALKANLLAAGLAASNLALYAFVYTPMKQMHPVNTWVGAIVGAIPPLLGWVAASGEVSLNGMLLPAALYFWQIPHFMALAYLCRNDYAAGGFRMFSLTDASGQRTALVSLRNCLYLIPLGYLAYDWGITSGWFSLEASLLTLCMSAAAMSFFHDRTAKSARRMFHASLLYLPLFMSGLLFHRLPNEQPELLASNLSRLDELSGSEEIQVLEGENSSSKRKLKTDSPSTHARRPPVAYASVAPFPFLPAPLYVFPDQ